MLASVGGSITVAAFCEEFLDDAAENLEQSTYTSYRYGCQKFVDFCGSNEAHRITPLDVQKFSVALKQTLNETSRVIVLHTVQRCFNWGEQVGLIPPHNLKHIRKPQPKRRDRYLTDDEFARILRATNPRDGRRSGAPMRRLLLALDWTLCRPGELAKLKWEHIHVEQHVAILPDHKTKRTGKPKIIALIPKMLRLLDWLQQQSNSDCVFMNSRGRPWTQTAIAQRMVHIRERASLGNDVVAYTMRHRV